MKRFERIESASIGNGSSHRSTFFKCDEASGLQVFVESWCPKKWPRPKFSYITTTWHSPRKYATWFLPVHGDTPENKIDRFKTHPVQNITVLNSPSFCLPKGDDPLKPPLLKLPLSPSGKPLNNREENQTKNISIMAGQLVVSTRRWSQMPT